MTKTLVQLRNRVLQKLKVLSGSDTATAEDAALVDDAIPSVNEKLRDREFCFWTDDTVPESVFEDLAAYVGCHVAGDFMSESEAQAYRAANEQTSLLEIKRVCFSRPRTRQQTRQDYF